MSRLPGHCGDERLALLPPVRTGDAQVLWFSGSDLTGGPRPTPHLQDPRLLAHRIRPPPPSPLSHQNDMYTPHIGIVTYTSILVASNKIRLNSGLDRHNDKLDKVECLIGKSVGQVRGVRVP